MSRGPASISLLVFGVLFAKGATAADANGAKPTPLEVKICSTSNSLQAHDLRVEDVRKPLDLEAGRRISFSWLPKSAQTKTDSIGYRIIVATSREKLSGGLADVWDSREVSSSDSSNVEFKGAKLQTGLSYFWSVALKSSSGDSGCFAEPQMFATGFGQDWRKSEFIEASAAKHSWLKKTFQAEKKNIESATIRVLAEDRFKFWIDGEFVGSGPTRAFEPVGKSRLAGWLGRINSLLLKKASVGGQFKMNSAAFDVTSLVGSGKESVISFHTKGAARIVLTLQYADGETQDIVSDDTWLARNMTSAFVRNINGFGRGLISPISLDPAGRQVVDEYEHIDGEIADLADLKAFRSDGAWKPANSKKQLFFRDRTRQLNMPSAVSSLIAPEKISKTKSGSLLLDFGSTWIAGVSLGGLVSADAREIEVRYGVELTSQGGVQSKLQEFHGSPIEFRESWRLKAGENNLEHFGWRAFRWVEIAGLPAGTDVSRIRIRTYHYPSESSTADFHSSESDLNRFWEVVRHTQKALTLDFYMDTPNRERMPYEADAYINSQCHAMMDREFSMMRLMVKYFVDNPTWPTEWRFYPIGMAWENYLRDGNLHELRSIYDSLKTMTQSQFAKSEWDGLIDPPTDPVIDWPKSERGGFELKEINIVENSFYFWGLSQMAEIAKAVGNTTDNAAYLALAQQVEVAINKHFWDSGTSRYRDGVGTNASAWISNYLPVALGVKPPGGLGIIRKTFEALPANEFPSSPYGAFWVLKALFRLELGEKATSLMLARGTRTWHNMIIRGGGTTTFEAWAPELKENMSRNHPWSCGIVPALYQDVGGVRAIDPGFKKFEVRPQMGVIADISFKLATLSGVIEVQSRAQVGGTPASLKVEVPIGSQAKLCLPLSKKQHLVFNKAKQVRTNTLSNSQCVEVGSGTHVLSVAN